MTSVLGMQDELRSHGPMHSLLSGTLIEYFTTADTPQFSAL